MKTSKPEPLTCPQAYRGQHMRIFCRKLGDACRHQRFCSCCGWYILNEQSHTCGLRKDDEQDAE